MNPKRVRTVEEIVFDRANPPEILPKGSEYYVELFRRYAAGLSEIRGTESLQNGDEESWH